MREWVEEWWGGEGLAAAMSEEETVEADLETKLRHGDGEHIFSRLK